MKMNKNKIGGNGVSLAAKIIGKIDVYNEQIHTTDRQYDEILNDALLDIEKTCVRFMQKHKIVEMEVVKIPYSSKVEEVVRKYMCRRFSLTNDEFCGKNGRRQTWEPRNVYWFILNKMCGLSVYRFPFHKKEAVASGIRKIKNKIPANPEFERMVTTCIRDIVDQLEMADAA
jgi:hypothetical protein